MEPSQLNYRGANILAPMVRAGTHPMRMLSLRYGADIVYTEETVDKRVVASLRKVNEQLGTVDYLDKGGNEGGRVMFRTCAAEKPRLVFQLGTADAAGALAAASMVAGDVAGVDVNMGCPKQFSTQGGMGAALLKKPDVAEDILKTLRRNLNIPVTCKIRILDDPRDTVELARRLAACGISALAVHGRTTVMRPREPARWERIKEVVASLPDLPVIANGDVMSYADAQRVREATGCTGAMFARGAMWNASVFRPEGFLPLDEVQREYVRTSLLWENALPNSKYVLKEMADAPVTFAGKRGGPRSLVGHEGNTAITKAKDEQQLCALVGIAHTSPYEDLPYDDSAHEPAAASGGQRASNGQAGKRAGRKERQRQRQQQEQQQEQAAAPDASAAAEQREGEDGQASRKRDRDEGDGAGEVGVAGDEREVQRKRQDNANGPGE